MLTNVLPPQPIPHKPRQRRRKKGFDILGLPADLFVMIVKDHINVYDRASLALVCKAFAQKVTSFNTILQLPAPDQDRGLFGMAGFFRNTIKSWFPSHLKFCQICGKYVPRDRAYWEEILLKECAGHAGNTSRNFFEWTASPDKNCNSMGEQYNRWMTMKQSRTCPRCRLHKRPRF